MEIDSKRAVITILVWLVLVVSYSFCAIQRTPPSDEILYPRPADQSANNSERS